MLAASLCRDQSALGKKKSSHQRKARGAHLFGLLRFRLPWPAQHRYSAAWPNCRRGHIACWAFVVAKILWFYPCWSSSSWSCSGRGEGEGKRELRLRLPSWFAAYCLLKCKCDESIEFISHTNTHRYTQTHTRSHTYTVTHPHTHTHTDTDYILRLS